ncbi:hypothetical protein ACWCSD_50370 [Nonomuraea sp. NPDC001684]
MAFHPDGHLLATAGDDGTARLWPSETQGSASGHRWSSWVRSLSYSSKRCDLARHVRQAGCCGCWRVHHRDVQQLGLRREATRRTASPQRGRSLSTTRESVI